MFALGEELLQYQKQGFISFHTPGHKGKREFFDGLNFPDQDLTELPGLDMLHAPVGVIAEAQRRAAEVFQSDASFFLVNGGTVGNQAMFLSLASHQSANSGKKVLVERQSHRSVLSALVLSGLEPEYIPSVVHPEFHLPLGLELEKVSRSWSEVQAVHLTYPGYYGSLPNLNRLVRERNALAPEIPIFVDQAHGSHYLNSLFPQSALDQGADLVLHSTHKTLSALTQAAILHVKGSRIQISALRQALEILQSSSPSYLFLASLERAVEFALQTKRWELLYEAVQELHHQAGQVVRILNAEDKGHYEIAEVDWAKILINTNALGVPAPVCVEHLRNIYRIEPELWDDENILFLLGIGNTPEEVRVLTEGLLSLAHLRKSQDHSIGKRVQTWNGEYKIPFPPVRYSPREAFYARKRKISLKESLGKVVGESISPYPPGIPLIAMGEEMTSEVLEILSNREMGRWQGWEDPGRTVWIIEEV